MRCHPDRNSTEAARLEFIAITAAYAKVTGKNKNYGARGGSGGDGGGAELGDLAEASLDLAWAVAFAGREVIDAAVMPLAQETVKEVAMPLFRSVMSQVSAVAAGSTRPPLFPRRFHHVCANCDWGRLPRRRSGRVGSDSLRPSSSPGES